MRELPARRYPALEALTGMRLNEIAPARRVVKEAALSKRLDATRALPARVKFQQLIERAVKTLLVTASPDGDLTFRADVDAAVMNDLSVDVMLEDGALVISFYTSDSSVRRLLQGYERELKAHLDARGLKVKRIVHAKEPDANADPAVPLHSR